MPLWDKSGTKPQNLKRAQKRNVIATNAGWVRRRNYTDMHSNARVKEEILVAVAGIANSTHMGTPTISDMWFANTSISDNSSVTIFIAYDEPVAANTLSGRAKLNVANTISGTAMVATANTRAISGANNTLAFTFTANTPGTYKVQAQTIANSTATAIAVKSTNEGTEAVSLIISGVVSNTAGTFVVTA